MSNTVELMTKLDRALAMAGRISAEQTDLANRQARLFEDIAEMQVEIKSIAERANGNHPTSPLLASTPAKVVASVPEKKQEVEPERSRLSAVEEDLKQQLAKLLAENRELLASTPRKYDLMTMDIGTQRSIPYEKEEANRLRSAIANAEKTYMAGSKFFTRTVGDNLVYGRIK